jgi:hypothetical protein
MNSFSTEKLIKELKKRNIALSFWTKEHVLEESIRCGCPLDITECEYVIDILNDLTDREHGINSYEVQRCIEDVINERPNEPRFAIVSGYWNEDGRKFSGYIMKLSKYAIADQDDHIFFYAHGGMEELESFFKVCQPSSSRGDFTLTSINEFMYEWKQ